MKIGFYGDSFCCEESNPHSILKGYTTYISKLKKELNAEVVHLGVGGSSVWDIVLQQFDVNDVPDICIFCWTDSSRLYNKKVRNITYGSIKDKKIKDLTITEMFNRNIMKSAKMYYENLFDSSKHDLEYAALLYYFDQTVLSKIKSKIVHVWSFENKHEWANGINIKTPLINFTDGNDFAANHINGDTANDNVCKLIMSSLDS